MRAAVPTLPGDQVTWLSNVSRCSFSTGAFDYLNIDLNGLVDESRSVDLLGTFDTQVVINGDTVIVPFTEATRSRSISHPEALHRPVFPRHPRGRHGEQSGPGRRGRYVADHARRREGSAATSTRPLQLILDGVIPRRRPRCRRDDLSLGGSFRRRATGAHPLINRVFDYGRRQGVTIVVSAGKRRDRPRPQRNTYESFCDTPAVICVSATGPTQTPQGSPVRPVHDGHRRARVLHELRAQGDRRCRSGGNSSFGRSPLSR